MNEVLVVRAGITKSIPGLQFFRAKLDVHKLLPNFLAFFGHPAFSGSEIIMGLALLWLFAKNSENVSVWKKWGLRLCLAALSSRSRRSRSSLLVLPLRGVVLHIRLKVLLGT